VLVLLAFALVSSVAALVFLPDAVAPYVVGALLASGAWLNYVFMLQTGGVMSHVLGVMGEQWTADELRKLQRRGWTIVNHVMLERRDVDHLALGPGGFYTIETKFRSSVDRITDDQLAEWAEIAWRSARGVRTRLRTDRRVQPIIAVWGPGARNEYSEPLDVDGVLVCAGVDVVQTILSSEARIESNEVAIAFDHIDRYVATRDRGEAREHGELARSLADYTFDFLTGILGAMVALWVIFASASLPLGGLWMLGAAMVIGGGAFLVRGRLVSEPRLFAVTTGCLGRQHWCAAIAGRAARREPARVTAPLSAICQQIVRGLDETG
jgi:hypothetical protein